MEDRLALWLRCRMADGQNIFMNHEPSSQARTPGSAIGNSAIRQSAIGNRQFLKSLADCRLYAFVDAAYLGGRTPAALAESLCLGGSDIIQWRAKGWPREKVLETARELRPILESHGVWLVINDHIDIARSVCADACHLGQEDFFGRGYTQVTDLDNPAKGRASSRFQIGTSRGVAVIGGATESTRTLGAPLAIGLSTHAPEQAQAAVTAAADYIAVGPVYATGTKPGARPVTLDYVRWASANIAIPWFAIGGINLENLDAVLKAGARRVCVVSAILNASDVRAACRQFKERLENWPPTR